MRLRVIDDGRLNHLYSFIRSNFFEFSPSFALDQISRTMNQENIDIKIVTLTEMNSLIVNSLVTFLISVWKIIIYCRHS